MAPDARGLVARYGSPLYFYDLAAVDKSWTALRSALPQPSTLYFSVKANPHPKLLAHLQGLGAHAEVSSLGELRQALAGGFDPSTVLLTGPAKTSSGLRDAIALGCRQFSVESLCELRRLGSVAAISEIQVRALLRVNVDAPLRVPGGMAFGGVASQFGIDLSLLLAQLGQASATPSAQVAGLHFFLGTNLLDEAALATCFETAIAAASAVVQAGLFLSVLDLGGGFGTPFGVTGPQLDFASLGPRLEAALGEHLPRWADQGPTLCFESGRYLVGPAGSLICTVVETKVSKGVRFAVLDSGIHHLGGMAGLRRVPQLDLQPSATGNSPLVPTRVVGPLCTTLDTWSIRAPLPEDLQAGDLLSIPNVGAYGLTASLLAFLSHEAPTEVVVDVDGHESASQLTIERRSLTDH